MATLRLSQIDFDEGLLGDLKTAQQRTALKEYIQTIAVNQNTMIQIITTQPETFGAERIMVGGKPDEQNI